MEKRNSIFEPLESRQLMSVSLSNGVLSVVGTNNNDVITFEFDRVSTGGSGPAVGVTDWLEINDNGVVSRRLLTSQLPGAQISSIVVTGMGGNDRIEVIDGGDGMLTRDMYVEAGGGNDTVVTGDGVDTVYGGDNDDSITGNEGADYLDGDSGNDDLFGNEGRDSLFGDCGNDDIHGGDQNDSIKGQQDEDTLHGGQGSDSLWGGDNDDELLGNDGADSLLGEAGDDTLTGGADGHVDTMTGGSGTDLFRTDVTEWTHSYTVNGIDYTLHGEDYEDTITDKAAGEDVEDI